MRTVITSSDRSQIRLAELRQFSGLLKYLSLRDVFVRYKQTRIGFGWSIIRPVVNVVIFGSLSWLVNRSGSFSETFVQVSAGVVLWQLISTTITDVSNSLSSNANILTKVYFPKILLPFSGILVCLIDFGIAFTLFLISFIAFYGLPGWQVVLLPLVLLYALAFCLGVGLVFATGSVKYRDVKFMLPFILQILFYVSPVFIKSSFVMSLQVPEFLKVLYQLNPLVFILNSFKFCFFGTFDHFDPLYTAISICITAVICWWAFRYFLNVEKSFADYI